MDGNFSTVHVTERAPCVHHESAFKPKENRHSNHPFFVAPPPLPSETAAPLDNFGVPQCMVHPPTRQRQRQRMGPSNEIEIDWTRVKLRLFTRMGGGALRRAICSRHRRVNRKVSAPHMQNNERSCLALLSSPPRPYIPLSSYPLSIHPSAKGLAYNHTAFAAGVVFDVLYHNFNLPAEHNNVI
jgi:hypothetical protein